MKIIYLTDVHGSFARVYSLLRETIADLYIISGNLLDMPFYSLVASSDFYDAQQFLSTLRARNGRDNEVLEDYAAFLLNGADTDDSLKAATGAYLEQSRNAHDAMLKKYRILENIFSTKAHVPIYTLPGTYDMNLSHTPLSERDLHMKSRRVGPLTIAGYGGAGVRTPGFPEWNLYDYGGPIMEDGDSDVYRFFESSSPDIIAVHHPALGIPDRLNTSTAHDSHPLRSYCGNHAVTMCLSGNIPDQRGLRYEEGILYCNAQNFGDIIIPIGEPAEGGFFYEFEIEDRRATRIIFRRFIDQRIQDIATYDRSNDGYRETLLTEKEPYRLSKKRKYENNGERYGHIPELKIFRDVRNFFRVYQTPQSEKRVTALNNAISGMGADSTRIALDLVGSVNMGMSLDSSDIDLVLYTKGFSEYTDDAGCDLFNRYEKRLRDALDNAFGIQAIDYISLDEVEDSIRNRRYDCQATQRFAAYRSMCRPVNYQLIAPLEDMLNADIHYRRIVEENLRSYLRAFASTRDNRKSFEKYLNRLTSIGIEIPEAVTTRIRRFLESYRDEDMRP